MIWIKSIIDALIDMYVYHILHLASSSPGLKHLLNYRIRAERNWKAIVAKIHVFKYFFLQISLDQTFSFSLAEQCAHGLNIWTFQDWNRLSRYGLIT